VDLLHYLLERRNPPGLVDLLMASLLWGLVPYLWVRWQDRRHRRPPR
jgi:hypothetical protein